MSSESDEINECEENDPHQVDEVPVKADVFQGCVVLRCVHATQRLQECTEDHEHTHSNVSSVETGHGEEAAGEDAYTWPEVACGTHSDGEDVPQHELIILINLNAEERSANHHGGEEEHGRLFTIVTLGSAESQNHGD